MHLRIKIYPWINIDCNTKLNLSQKYVLSISDLKTNALTFMHLKFLYNIKVKKHNKNMCMEQNLLHSVCKVYILKCCTKQYRVSQTNVL